MVTCDQRTGLKAGKVVEAGLKAWQANLSPSCCSNVCPVARTRLFRHPNTVDGAAGNPHEAGDCNGVNERNPGQFCLIRHCTAPSAARRGQSRRIGGCVAGYWTAWRQV